MSYKPHTKAVRLMGQCCSWPSHLVWQLSPDHLRNLYQCEQPRFTSAASEDTENANIDEKLNSQHSGDAGLWGLSGEATSPSTQRGWNADHREFS